MPVSNQQSNGGTPIVNEQIDDRVFKFQVYFWNNDGKITRIPKSTIQELVINDNILDWYHSGHVTFSNPKDVFERVTKKYTLHNNFMVNVSSFIDSVLNTSSFTGMSTSIYK